MQVSSSCLQLILLLACLLSFLLAWRKSSPYRFFSSKKHDYKPISPYKSSEKTGKIVKISCGTTDLVYYGCTTTSVDLYLRTFVNMYGRNITRQAPTRRPKVYLVLENNNYTAEVVEEMPKSSMNELKLIHRDYLINNPCVNVNIPRLMSTDNNNNAAWRRIEMKISPSSFLHDNATSGRIYRLYCKTNHIQYYGCTKKSLNTTLSQTIRDFNRYHMGTSHMYKSVYRTIEAHNYDIELVEELSNMNCSMRQERLKYYINNNPCVNEALSTRQSIKVRPEQNASLVIKNHQRSSSYSNEKLVSGKIFKLFCRITGFVYYGSTIESISNAMSKLRSAHNRYLNGQGAYTAAFRVMELQDYDCELVEAMEACTAKGLRLKLAEYIETTAHCVNVISSKTTIDV
jgi:hypothetical protein